MPSPNETSVPTERVDASATTSLKGNWRWTRTLSISRPTLPVAPTTATLYAMRHPLLDAGTNTKMRRTALAAPLQADHGPAAIDAAPEGGHQRIGGLGGKGFPFAVRDAQGPRRFIAIGHGIGLG